MRGGVLHLVLFTPYSSDKLQNGRTVFQPNITTTNLLDNKDRQRIPPPSLDFLKTIIDHAPPSIPHNLVVTRPGQSSHSISSSTRFFISLLSCSHLPVSLSISSLVILFFSLFTCISLTSPFFFPYETNKQPSAITTTTTTTTTHYYHNKPDPYPSDRPNSLDLPQDQVGSSWVVHRRCGRGQYVR